MAVVRETLHSITLKKCLDFRHRQLLNERLSVEQAVGDIELDLSDLGWINVFTISAILKLHERLRRRKRQLRIRGCNEEVFSAFHYLGLDKLIDISRLPAERTNLRTETGSTP